MKSSNQEVDQLVRVVVGGEDGCNNTFTDRKLLILALLTPVHCPSIILQCLEM